MRFSSKIEYKKPKAATFSETTETKIISESAVYPFEM